MIFRILALGLALAFVQAAAADGPMTPITPTFRSLQADLLANNITSSQAMLHFLATTPQYQPLLQSAILERKSFALHGDQVTDEFPRIVMSSGNLTVHLTSDMSKKGDRLIEVVEFDPASTQLKFDLINFGGPTGTPEFYEKADNAFLPFDKIGQETGGAVFSCSACHSSSGDEGFGNIHWSPLDGLQRVYGGGADLIPRGSEEFAAFQKFLAVKNDPVRGTIYQDLKLNYLTDKDGNIIFPGQPNEKFTEHVYETARRKGAASMQKFSGYTNYQYAIAGALMNCADIQSFLPADSRTVHEKWLMKDISDINIDFEYSIDTKQLQHSDMTDAFWKTQTGKRSNLSEADFLANTTLPLIDALAVPLAHLNRDAAARVATNFQGEDAADYLFAQEKYLEPAYLARMAKLRYLLFGYIPELPADVFAPVNEVTQSGKGGFASITYRLLGANDYFDAMLAENFGPKFLSDNPDLSLFKDGVMSVDALNVPVGDYCARLKAKSIAAFAVKPLSKDPSGGTNGALCGDAIGACRFPLACTDRGDGVKACTGGVVQKGTLNQLCAGPGSEQSVFFCGPELGCAARTDGVLTCQTRAPGSGQIFEACDPTHTGFCAPGLVCHPVDKTCEKPQTPAPSR